MNAKTKQIFKKIKSMCGSCQRISDAPIRFKVAIKDLKFDDGISIDIMLLDGKAVLLIMDTETQFAAAFLITSCVESYCQSVEGIW